MDFNQSIRENSPVGYAYHKILLDENNSPSDYEFIEVNIAFENLTGLKRSDILGKNISEVLPDIKKSELNRIQLYGNTAINGTSEEFEYYSEPVNRWYKVSVYSPEKYYFITRFIDITKEKSQLAELQKSKDRLANILEGTNVGTWEWNVQTGETVFNERWAAIIGYTLNEISPVSIETWIRFVHVDDLKQSESQLQQVFEKVLDYYDVECRMKHKNGSWVWVQDRGKVTMWSADGKPIIVSGTHTDITERKRVEDELLISDYKLKEAQKLSHIGHWDWDYQKNILSWSDEVFQIFGIAIGESAVSTENFENAIHPDDLQFFLNERKKSLDAGNDVSIEHRIIRPDGEIRFVHERARIIRDVDEKPLFVLGTIQDTTERKQAEDALRDSEFRFHMAVESTNTGIWDWDMINDEVAFSIQWKKMLGYEDHEVENAFAGWKNLWHPDDAASIEKALNDHLAGKTAKYEIIHRCRHKDGDWRWIVTRGEILKDRENKPYRWIGTNVDITELKKTEAELIKAKEQAEVANAAKSQFLANMSHEIRTPMNGFMGMIQLMQTTELTEEQQDFMRIAKTSANGLMYVINNILEYSRIEAGKIQFEKITFNLRKMIKDTIDLFKVSAENIGLRIEASIKNDVPEHLVGDSFRLNQILSNLIGNAVKFTQKGSIVIEVKVESRERAPVEEMSKGSNSIDVESRERVPVEEMSKGSNSIDVKDSQVQSNEGVMLKFVVKDTGIGIPHDKVDILFQRFSQVNSSTTHVYGGSGLGLSICKGLVEKMGGEIWVESIEGEGSSFYFTSVF